MAARETQAGSTRSRLAAAAAFACLAALLVAIALAAPADAVKSREIGKTRQTPSASCPTPPGEAGRDYPLRKSCQVFGEVTGFQKKADNKLGLMRIPADGHIVGWAVDLGHPDKRERETFDGLLSGDPSARLAMLTHADENKYRLRAQTPTVKLNRLYGRRQYFTLRNPLEVKEGWITSLTSASWIPNFAHDLKTDAKDNIWKASRTRKRCSGFNNLTERSQSHSGVGSTRAYGCTYTDARILYWAYFVPS